MGAITNGGEAALAHQRLENSEDHLYSLRLEENEDGRRRALLQTFEVFENPSPKDDEPPFEIWSTYGYWDAERDQVVLRPFNFRGERDAAGFKDMPVG